jgi:DNA-binding winged helix-turn-helix (wHTH) protein
MRATAQRGRRAGPAEHAGFLHLVTLLSRPNEVVGKSNLTSQVWLSVTVEEGSLRIRFRVPEVRQDNAGGRNGASADEREIFRLFQI